MSTKILLELIYIRVQQNFGTIRERGNDIDIVG